MQENIVVYETLRAHILQRENQIANETIYMYVTYFTLLAVSSIWNSWLFLTLYISLIVFQSMINADQWSITKASIYIRIFFEDQRTDIHWESLQHDPFCVSVVAETINNGAGWYIRKLGATILSVISLLFVLFDSLYDSDYQINVLSLDAIIRIIFAFALCILTIYVNKQYFSVRDDKKSNGKLTQAIDDFHKKILIKRELK